MKITVIRYSIDKNGIMIVPGERIWFISHISGGLVRVQLESGIITTFPPTCFKETL